MKLPAILCAVTALFAAVPNAAAAEPNPPPMSAERVREFQDLRFGMFLCWSFSTFSGYEWTPGVEDINFFHPTGFDPDSWCAAAKEAEMSYILFLSKHHDGFCLWDTATTDRKVGNTISLPENDRRATSADRIFADYQEAVRHRNLFSLNIGPDRAGQLRAIDRHILREVGERIRAAQR